MKSLIDDVTLIMCQSEGRWLPWQPEPLLPVSGVITLRCAMCERPNSFRPWHYAVCCWQCSCPVTSSEFIYMVHVNKWIDISKWIYLSGHWIYMCTRQTKSILLPLAVGPNGEALHCRKLGSSIEMVIWSWQSLIFELEVELKTSTTALNSWSLGQQTTCVLQLPCTERKEGSS